MMTCSHPEGSPDYQSQINQGLVSRALIADLMQAVLDRGVPFRFTASGHSMSPFILDNDVLTLAPLPDKSASLGDVIAFLLPSPQVLFIHRVIAKRGSNYLVRGDNNPSGPDDEIPRNRIIGRVIRIERNGQQVNFGLGIEKFLIAILSRLGLLVLLTHTLVKFKQFLCR